MLPLVCVTTGISHRVQLAILVNFPNAVLNGKRFYNYLKSHSLRKSDTFKYGLEMEKIDFSETFPIFNLY